MTGDVNKAPDKRFIKDALSLPLSFPLSLPGLCSLDFLRPIARVLWQFE